MNLPQLEDTASVTFRGAERWVRGHPWIYRSDVTAGPAAAGIVRVVDPRGRFMGQGLYSPGSEIRLRLLDRTDQPIDRDWWRRRISEAADRRVGIDATAWRVVHGEADGLPSLVADRYDRWLVVQLLSAPLETQRDDVLAALDDVLNPDGILLRHDAAVRGREGLSQDIEQVKGVVPPQIEIREGAVRYLADPWRGQKTGAFLDQRANRILAGALTRPGGRALDCFAYHGSFALHLAQRAASVLALDASADALARGAENATLNHLDNIEWQVGDAFERLRALEREGAKFDTIALDPPAFAKSRGAVPAALRGYREVNLRAMRLLAPGGRLVTASCSFHVRLPAFLGMLAEAAGDSGRTIELERILGQSEDHPEVLTIPETAYLKGAVLRAR
ncbi:MAG TPA: class I SAM-dependent rRNA methyltransferase [Gemmatimonadales bacterium]|nr:class I SAM-dependent rRNA methyltransferase [Gemmatimonadales bacterium]